jgi:hypothetical protein
MNVMINQLTDQCVNGLDEFKIGIIGDKRHRIGTHFTQSDL